MSGTQGENRAATAAAEGGAPDGRTGQRCLVVLGMHRSGTSLLAGILQKVGVEFGRGLLIAREDNQSGFFEHKAAVGLNEELLSQAGTSWELLTTGAPLAAAQPTPEALAQIVAALRADLGGSPLCGLKDPRMCRLMPAWRTIFAAMGTAPLPVIVTRHPLESAASLRRRNGLTLRQGCLLWLDYCLQAEAATRQDPARVFLTYQGLLADWEGALEAVRTGFDLSWPRPLEEVRVEIGGFVRPDLRHEKAMADGDCPAVALRAFEIFTRLAARDVAPEPLWRELDDMRQILADLLAAVPGAAQDLPVPPGQERGETRYESLLFQVYHPQGGGRYDEFHSTLRRYCSDLGWKRLEFELLPPPPGEVCHAVRVDPADQRAVIDIGALTLRSAISGEVRWEAKTPRDFDALTIAGSARRLPHDRYLQLFSFGGDPHLFLPGSLFTAGDDPLRLEVRFRATTDEAYLAGLMQPWIDAYQGMPPGDGQAAPNAPLALPGLPPPSSAPGEGSPPLLQVYFSRDGIFHEQESQTIPVALDCWERLRIPVPRGWPGGSLRIDPGSGFGLVDVAGVRIRTVTMDMEVWQLLGPDLAAAAEVSGSAVAIPAPRLLRVLCAESDPQIVLHSLDTRDYDEPLVLEIGLFFRAGLSALSQAFQDLAAGRSADPSTHRDPATEPARSHAPRAKRLADAQRQLWQARETFIENQDQLTDAETELQELRAALREQREEQTASRLESAGLRAEVEALRGQMQTRESTLAQTSQRLAETQAHLTGTSQQLFGVREGWEETSQRLAATHQRWTEAYQGWVETNAHLTEARQGWAATHQNLVELHHGWAETNGYLEEARRGWAATHQNLLEAHHGWTETSVRLAETSARLAQADGQLAQTNGQLAEASARLAQADGQLAQTNGQLAEASARLSETARTLEDKNSRLAEALAKGDADHGRLVSMRRSASWKLTLPLRVTGRLLTDRTTGGKRPPAPAPAAPAPAPVPAVPAPTAPAPAMVPAATALAPPAAVPAFAAAPTAADVPTLAPAPPAAAPVPVPGPIPPAPALDTPALALIVPQPLVLVPVPTVPAPILDEPDAVFVPPAQVPVSYNGGYRFNFDEPSDWDAPSQRVSVRGWCLPPDGSDEPVPLVRFRCGERQTDVVCDVPRADVQIVHGANPRWLLCGFAAVVELPGGPSEVIVEAVNAAGEAWPFARFAARAPYAARANHAAPADPGQDYAGWVERYDRLSAAQRRHVRAQARVLGYRPLISVVMPVYNAPEEWLCRAIDSVRAQLYPFWELCIADDASPAPHVREVLGRYERLDPRIKVVYREANGHISAASNSALALAGGEFVALLDHDDELPPHALYAVAVRLNEQPGLQMIYSDEDKIGEDNQRRDPYFKPDWNYDLFLGQNLFSHLGVFRRDLLTKIGGFQVGLEGSQDYDLALRCLEHVKPEEVGHITQILYHWRMIPGSTSVGGDEKPYAREAARRAIGQHFARLGSRATVEQNPWLADFHRVRRPLPTPPPEVAIIIPTRDHADILRTCIESLCEHTDYPNYRIVVVDNGSREPETFACFEELSRRLLHRFQVLSHPGEFNFSALNNFAVREAGAPLLCLLNNDIEARDAGWLTELASQAMRPEVGAAGARLLYPNGTVQHAGIIIGLGADRTAGHMHQGLPGPTFGYFGRTKLIQQFSAVTAACMVLRREVFDEVGGFNEADFPVGLNDVDLCLRLRERDYLIIWTPFAELIHHESYSRGLPVPGTPAADRARLEAERFRQRHWRFIQHDPAYNPNLTLDRADFAFSLPPRKG